MKTYAQCLDLVDDPVRIAEYVAHHRAVWPAVVEGLRALGLERLQLFRHGARLVMVYDAPDDFDPSRDDAAYQAHPDVQAWERLMAGYQRPVPGADEGAWWQPMETVFRLDDA